MHKFTFYRVGDVDQVVVSKGADLVHLDQLDAKLWIALSMPTKGVHFDARTLELLDTDKDGIIRLPEVHAAIKFVRESYQDPDVLLKGGDGVPLAALVDGPLRKSAARLLATVKAADPKVLTLADVAAQKKLFSSTARNGDGVVTRDGLEDGELGATLDDIVAAAGGVEDRSGKKGSDAAKVKGFFESVRATAAWLDRGAEPQVRVAGEHSEAAAGAVEALRVKVDDYFARGGLLALDPRSAAITLAEGDIKALEGKQLSASLPEMQSLPLARIEAGRPLSFKDSVNPAFQAALGDLHQKAVEPLLGPRSALSEADWRHLVAKLAPYGKWLGDKPKGAAEKLPAERIRALAASDHEQKLAKLIAEDLEVAPDYEAIVELEKLVRLQRDLALLLRNFVNFADFYGKKGATFQTGTLYLDGRACDLCCDVTDAGKHASLAAMSGAYLAYCDVTRQGEKKAIVAAVTAGDSDNIFVGRNGLFVDREGRDWHATITKIIDNPISVRQAFWAPYKKFARLLDEQFAKRAAAAEAASQAKLATSAEAVANADKTKKAAPEAPKKMDIGTVAAIGIAVGGIGALVTAILAGFFGLGVWMPLGFMALLLIISGPSMLLAYMKLRRRNLGPLLDANGWAINGRVKINVPFGGALTTVAALPKGAKRSARDPYAPERSPWRLYSLLIFLLVIAGCWYLGKLDRFLPIKVRSITVLGVDAPAYKPPPPPVPVVGVPVPVVPTTPTP